MLSFIKEYGFIRVESRYNSGEVYLIPSDSGKEPYEVWKSSDGDWKCGCPHFQFRLAKHGTKCKHILRLIERKVAFEAAMMLTQQLVDWTVEWDEEVPKYK